MNRKKTAVLGGVTAALASMVVAGLFFGWDLLGLALTGLGCGIGAYLGVSLGNREAKKVDAYREEWLNKRKKRTLQPGERNSDDAPQPPAQ